MGTITKITTAVTGDTITAAVWNDEFDQIINLVNGGLDNANIAAGAGIAYSKLDLTGAVQTTDLDFTPVTTTGTQTLTNKTLTKPIVNGSVPTLEVNSDDTTITFDMSARNQHITTLGGNRTLAVSNVSTGQAFVIHIKQDATGSRTVVWWSGILWSGGSAPTLTTTGSKIDTFGFIYDGTNYLGYIIGQNI